MGVEDLGPLIAKLDANNITYTLSKSGRPAVFFRDPGEASTSSNLLGYQLDQQVHGVANSSWCPCQLAVHLELCNHCAALPTCLHDSTPSWPCACCCSLPCRHELPGGGAAGSLAFLSRHSCSSSWVGVRETA